MRSIKNGSFLLVILVAIATAETVEKPTDASDISENTEATVVTEVVQEVTTKRQERSLDLKDSDIVDELSDDRSGPLEKRSIGNIARLLLGGNVPPNHPLVKNPEPKTFNLASNIVASVPGKEYGSPGWNSGGWNSNALGQISALLSTKQRLIPHLSQTVSGVTGLAGVKGELLKQIHTLSTAAITQAAADAAAKAVAASAAAQAVTNTVANAVQSSHAVNDALNYHQPHGYYSNQQNSYATAPSTNQQESLLNPYSQASQMSNLYQQAQQQYQTAYNQQVQLLTQQQQYRQQAVTPSSLYNSAPSYSSAPAPTTSYNTRLPTPLVAAPLVAAPSNQGYKPLPRTLNVDSPIGGSNNSPFPSFHSAASADGGRHATTSNSYTSPSYSANSNAPSNSYNSPSFTNNAPHHSQPPSTNSYNAHAVPPASQSNGGGYHGSSGNQGFQGPSGNGFQGSSGFQSSSGSNGFQGPSGSNNFQGPTGGNNFQGPQGGNDFQGSSSGNSYNGPHTSNGYSTLGGAGPSSGYAHGQNPQSAGSHVFHQNAPSNSGPPSGNFNGPPRSYSNSPFQAPPPSGNQYSNNGPSNYYNPGPPYNAPATNTYQTAPPPSSSGSYSGSNHHHNRPGSGQTNGFGGNGNSHLNNRHHGHEGSSGANYNSNGNHNSQRNKYDNRNNDHPNDYNNNINNNNDHRNNNDNLNNNDHRNHNNNINTNDHRNNNNNINTNDHRNNNKDNYSRNSNRSNYNTEYQSNANRQVQYQSSSSNRNNNFDTNSYRHRDDQGHSRYNNNPRPSYSQDSRKGSEPDRYYNRSDDDNESESSLPFNKRPGVSNKKGAGLRQSSYHNKDREFEDDEEQSGYKESYNANKHRWTEYPSNRRDWRVDDREDYSTHYKSKYRPSRRRNNGGKLRRGENKREPEQQREIYTTLPEYVYKNERPNRSANESQLLNVLQISPNTNVSTLVTNLSESPPLSGSDGEGNSEKDPKIIPALAVFETSFVA